MPNKLWSKLVETVSRNSAGEWAKELKIPDLTSSEWVKAGELGPNRSDAEIRRIILADRTKKR